MNFEQGSGQRVGPSIAARYGDPNQVVSASRNPVSVPSMPSPTQATYPIRSDQHGSGGCYLTQHRKLPIAGIFDIDRQHPVLPME